MDVKKATLAMLVVLKQEGLAPGGLNFDCKVSALVAVSLVALKCAWQQIVFQAAIDRPTHCDVCVLSKVRRESTDIEDMFISHIGAMDTFARGLRAAAAIIQVRQSLGDQIPTGFGRCMFLGCWVSRAFWNCRFCPLTASYPKPAALSLLLCPLDPCGD